MTDNVITDINPIGTNDDDACAIACEHFSRFLDSRKMRRTYERYAILKRICRIDSHFSIEELYEMMDSDGFHVSKATVYNTMQLLAEAGIVRRHHMFDQKSAEYERVKFGLENHYHMVCTACGKVIELKDSEIGDILTRRHYKNFAPSYFALYVYGLCSRCQRSRRAEKKKSDNQSHI